MDFHLTSLITTLTIILLFGLTINVGKARVKYKVNAPATTGHPKFELAYRVQMNTVENTVAFIPALWLFSYYVSTSWGSVLGGLWLIGRVWYAITYSEDAKKRGGGFSLSFLAFAILTFGALIEIVRQMV